MRSIVTLRRFHPHAHNHYCYIVAWLYLAVDRQTTLALTLTLALRPRLTLTLTRTLTLTLAFIPPPPALIVPPHTQLARGSMVQIHSYRHCVQSSSPPSAPPTSLTSHPLNLHHHPHTHTPFHPHLSFFTPHAPLICSSNSKPCDTIYL